MGTIIYIAGVVLSVLAVIDILKKPISVIGKVITAVLVLCTSWIGLAVYYLYARDHLTERFPLRSLRFCELNRNFAAPIR